MKTVIIDAGPRKGWNTDLILKEAQKGAESAGDQVEYYDLYSLSFTGCRSCLACKRNGIAEPCKCYWKDELTPVLESVLTADRLIMGSPVYFGQPTGEMRSFIERLVFPALSYNDYSSTFKGNIDVTVFLTMNADFEGYESEYAEKMKEYFGPLFFLNGTTEIIPVCNTLQVDDYSKYEMRGMPGEAKHRSREEQFPEDLKNAFSIGARE